VVTASRLLCVNAGLREWHQGLSRSAPKIVARATHRLWPWNGPTSGRRDRRHRREHSERICRGAATQPRCFSPGYVRPPIPPCKGDRIWVYSCWLACEVINRSVRVLEPHRSRLPFKGGSFLGRVPRPKDLAILLGHFTA